MLIINGKVFIIKILFVLSFSLLAEATSFCDLDTDIIQDFKAENMQGLPRIKQACVASEDFNIPADILRQTREMITREEAFRLKYNIAKATNVAQLCAYRIYEDGTCECIEIFDPRSCKGQFYLSGNGSVSLGQGRKEKTTHEIDVQTVSHGERGYIEIRQRLQPLLATIIDAVEFLSHIEKYVEHPNQIMPPISKEVRGNALDLAKFAQAKQKEIDALLLNKQKIISELHRFREKLRSISTPVDATTSSLEANIEKASYNFIQAVYQELFMCLKNDDFEFKGMGETRTNKNVTEFINSIQNQLSTRKLGDLLNSQYFNLGCSEPLLLFDLLGTELRRIELAKQIVGPLLGGKRLQRIVVQLHSTKTPCKSCLIGCCGHLAKDKLIGSFFQVMRAKVAQSYGMNDIALQFMISYNHPYEDKYPFYVPISSQFPSDASILLLLNMKFYNKEFQDLKRRIVEEEHLRLSKKLSELPQKESGIVSIEDVKAMLLS